MNLDELRSVQSTERKKDSLQNLRPSFYQEVGEYIADLEDERDRVAEQADDPFSSPEVSRLTDEIETAKDVVEAIYERRMGKLVKQASLAAAGMPADDEGLTAEEQDLFEDLVGRIESNKSHVLDVLEGKTVDDTAETESAPGASATDTPGQAGTEPRADAGATRDEPRDVAPPESSDPDPPAPPAPEPDPTANPNDDATESGLSPADAMGGGSPAETSSGTAPDSSGSPDSTADAPGSPGAAPDPSHPDAGGTDLDGSVETASGSTDPASGAGHSDAAARAPADEDVDRVTVRITRDVGSILGVDNREYTLSSDDIVTLPEQNADPLLEQEAAEPLE
ncbi:DNA replication complex subunit Gins51 [Halopiger goleimassiliensis]|uniref:DNA replication complex subunit Gins51 n=1 Tax=Halopiger goleimassiliensis TaxID=1293048 RepID=UPI0006779DFE|nr:hypothetical protein [Halopiger goleimassiliensis]